ncbi:hypothetical protein [Nannocystis sp. SCPEA4]|uniref:hypothetical protein n=1 Tax=Nannocystis sp. SCPEA4 TaxID=2996787 RepID=UPI00226F791E|nr:hypothetical protein [Nannocystis sp. SCPEA4]MCY1060600.1 hypothetical protein [Nannocystis sp. SCPEA4]
MSTARLLCLYMFAACQGPSAVASSSFGTSITATLPITTGAGSTSDAMSTSSSGSTTSTGSSGEDSAASVASSTTLVLDVGTEQDVENPQPAGCKGKIDFLFVISRDQIMAEEQAKLVAAFPEFIETIETKFAEFDYHIMVVDADNHWGWPECTEQCPALEGLCGMAEDYPCDHVPSACDAELGAGTIFNAGLNAPNKPCDLASGRRYIEKGQPELVETFTCLAQVGTSGYNRLGDAVAAAVSSVMTGSGACNEGFLRNDALLMVTIIGPPDQDSLGKPKEWADIVIGAKNGDADSVVMFRIGSEACPVYDAACRLAKYYFQYYHLSNQTDADFGPAFEIATDLVETACSAFIPG